MQLLRRVARPLLEVTAMRCLALAPLLVSAGCLYLGDLNHAPSFKLNVSTDSTIKGQYIHLDVTAMDPDAGDTLTVHHDIASADGPPATEACDYAVMERGTYGYDVKFFRTGSFKITTTVSDQLGATAPAQIVMVTINNAPPKFSMDSKLAPTIPVGACGFTATLPIPISFTGTAMDDDNTPDATSNVPGCPPQETLTFTWTLTPPAGSASAVFTPWMDHVGCVPMTSMSSNSLSETTTNQVCLWPDYGPSLTSAPYAINLTVSDGGDTKDSISASIPVTGDALPCITGMNPTEGSYVIDPKNPAPFTVLSVTSITDDLDTLAVNGGGTITFYWSLWRESDPVWRDIPIHTNSYFPDYSVFGVGEHIRIRVEAVDRTGTRASCSDPSVDECEVRSCNLPTCYQWKTWNLELR
jgi:hypothetical protein